MNDLSKVLTLCAAIALTGCAEEDPQQFIKEGQALFEKGDMKSAEVQFKNALQINPQLAEAYYGLALIDEENKDWASMKMSLQDTLSIDPNHLGANIKLGLVNRLAKQMDKAKEYLAVALKQNSNDIRVIMLQALILNDEGDKDKALQLTERILSQDSLNAEAISLKATILLSYKRYDEALALINHGIELYPKQLGLDMLKIQLHKEQNDQSAVLDDFRILVSKHPGNKTLYYSQLKALADMEKSELITEVLREGVSTYPDDIDIKVLLVSDLERHAPEDAEKLLLKYIEAHPESNAFKLRLAEFYLAHKRLSDARLLLTKISESDSEGEDGLNAKMRLADLAWLQKDKEVAAQLVKEVLETDANNSSGLLLRAYLRFDDKQADAVISDLRIVLRDQPESEKAMVLMANAYLLKGETEVAESYWKKVLEINPANIDAIIPMASAFVKREGVARAADLLNKAIKKSPKNPALLELLIKLHVLQKDWSSAKHAIDVLKDLSGSELAVMIMEGMLNQKQGNYQQAIKIYKEILTTYPNTVVALKDLGRAYQIEGDSKAWIDYLKGYIEQNQANILAYNMLGRAYAKEKKWEDSKDILLKAVHAGSKFSATYGVLAAVYIQQGQIKEATDAYLKGLDALPDNSELLMKLAKQYENIEQYTKAINIYSNLIKGYPDNVEIINNLAYLLVEQSEDEKAKERALLLVEQFKGSSNPYLLDTYGWVNFKVGRNDEAVGALQTAVSMMSGDTSMRYHLAEVYYAMGKSTESKIELEELLRLVKPAKPFKEIERVKVLLHKLNTQFTGV